MEYKFLLTGETPSKKNSRIVLANGKNIPSKQYRQWHEGAYFLITAQKNHQKLYKPIECPVILEVHFTHGDYRRRDCDNGLSSICDLLVDSGVLKDDNWQIVTKCIVTNGYDKNNASCSIIIYSN